MAGTVCVPATRAYAAGEVVLQAAAGVGGLAKADRWTPVRAVVTFSGTDLSADLTVAWGEFRLSRQLSFASPGTRTFELFVRTPEAAPLVRLEVISNGSTLASVDAPVRVLAQDEWVRLCVLPLSPAHTDTATCTATSSTGTLPSSMRGYETVDEVVWSDDGGERDLTPSQRTALDGWQAIRRLDRSGDLSLAPQPARPTLVRGFPADTSRTLIVAMTLYVALLAIPGFTLGLRGRNALRAYGVAAAAIIVSTCAVVFAGRAAPGRPVNVHHASLLQQIPGTASSLLTVRAIAEFPAFSTYSLEAAIADAALESSSTAGRAVQSVNGDGHPVLAGTFGLGARHAFLVEGVADVQPIAVTMDGSIVRAVNQTEHLLHDCRFGDGFPEFDPRVLEPGASMSAAPLSEGIGPIVTCAMRVLPVTLRAGERAVSATGVTVVAAYRTPSLTAAHHD